MRSASVSVCFSLTAVMAALVSPAGAAASAPQSIELQPIGVAGAGAPEPNSSSHTRLLEGLTAISSTDVWAVGATTFGSAYHAFSRHWDGAAWTRVKIVASGQDAYLRAAASAASDDVWAVGSHEVVPGTVENLIVHWDGASWSEVAAPFPKGTHFGYLTDVSVISSDNVLASGLFYPDGEEDVPSTQTLHWDGTSWSLVSKPPLAPIQTADAVSSTDAWGVGSADYDDPYPIARHWNGRQWTASDLPHSSYGERLTTVSEVAVDDVWTGGTTLGADGLFSDEWLLHYDGSDWSTVETDRAAGIIYSVDLDQHDDGWLVADGFYTGSPSVTEHWDGSQWSSVKTPAVGLDYAGLSEVVALSTTDAWAVGSHQNGNDTRYLLIHWNGDRWSRNGH